MRRDETDLAVIDERLELRATGIREPHRIPDREYIALIDKCRVHARELLPGNPVLGKRLIQFSLDQAVLCDVEQNEPVEPDHQAHRSVANEKES